MKNLVIVGAGQGLGMGIARAFGGKGFQVGLIARTARTLTALGDELAGQGITAATAAADLHDRASVTSALTSLEAELGSIDVLEYSPSPTGQITSAAATTVDSAADQFELHVLGAITAVHHVLPGMRQRGTGTILLTTGVSSLVAAPFLGNVGLAMSALRNWALALHTELTPEGVHVATVTIASGVVPGGGEADPDAIGARYYDLHHAGGRPEEVIGDVEAFKALVAASASTRGRLTT